MAMKGYSTFPKSTPGQSGPGSNGNEGTLYISQISKTGALSLDALLSYPGHSLEGSYPFADEELEYSTAPATGLLLQLCILAESKREYSSKKQNKKKTTYFLQGKGSISLR